MFINTQTFINLPAKGWYNTMGGLPALWAEYNTVDANGNPVDLSQRESYYYYMNGDQKVEKFGVKNTLTAEEAAEYTLKNVVGGDDNWQPDLMCEACDAPVAVKKDGKITWGAVPYAICYVVTKGDEVVGFTTDCEFDAYAQGDYKVQAVNEFGGLSKYGDAVSGTTGLELREVSPSPSQRAVFSIDGKPIKTMQRGVNIVMLQDGSARKVVK